MLAPKPRTNLPFESNFWIGLQAFETTVEHPNALAVAMSTWTLMAPPSWRPSAELQPVVLHLYGLGAALGSAAWV